MVKFIFEIVSVRINAIAREPKFAVKTAEFIFRSFKFGKTVSGREQLFGFYRHSLNNPCLFERCVRAALADSLQCARRKGERHVFVEFRYENFPALKVGLSASKTRRVVLGCTSPI